MSQFRRTVPLLAVSLTAVVTCGVLAGPGRAAQATAALTAATAGAPAAATAIPAGRGCPAGMKAWIPSARALASADPLAVGPGSMSPLARAQFGRQVLRLLAGHRVRWLGNSGCGHSRTRSTPPLTTASRGTPLKVASPGSTAQPTQGMSSNWSGYVSNAAGFTGVSMVWNVPAIASTAAPAEISIWPGIGQGDSSSDKLIQAGTDQNVTGSAIVWTELVPGQSQQPVGGMSASAGQRIAVNVGLDPATGTAAFLLVNYSTGVAKQITEPVSGSSGGSAEWIVERTEQCGNSACTAGIFPHLANFGNLQVANGTAQKTSNGITTGGYIGTFGDLSASTMQSCDGSKTMATVSGLSATGTFTDSFQDPGLVDPGHCQWTISPASTAFSATTSVPEVQLDDTTAGLTIGCASSTISGTTGPATAGSTDTPVLAVSKMSFSTCSDSKPNAWTVTQAPGSMWNVYGDTPGSGDSLGGEIPAVQLSVSGSPGGQPCSFLLTGSVPGNDLTWINDHTLRISTASLSVGGVSGAGCAASGYHAGDTVTMAAGYEVLTPSSLISIQPGP